MKLSPQLWLFIVGTILCNLFVLSPCQAQIIPDTTLPNGSSVITKGSTSNITGGTQAGTNLFHSFEQFSLPTGATAYFNNGIDIQNIITRVTGSSISNIDGTLRANSNTNLFLLNPNGIVFGPNARLNIGGSFIGSTASTISFADGNIFDAKVTQAVSLLTVSVPVGLGFGSTPAPIRVLGDGHNLLALNYLPIERNNPTTSLQVEPQKTLALVGGNVSLESGVLIAEGGRIELGGVEQGFVKLNLNPTNSSWNLSYEEISSFGDVSLSQASLVDASGSYQGSIQITGRRLQLKDGSLALIQNQGPFSTGSLAVNASESLYLEGFEPTGGVLSGFWVETLVLGGGGQITISAPQLTLQSSAQIYSGTFSAAEAADINISTNESLQVIGRQTGEIGAVFISSFSAGSGQSGDITISTKQLDVANGGFILTANLTPFVPGTMSGDSGNIEINANDFVRVDGVALNLYNPSAISAATFSNGSAGNVTVNTSKLIVSNGGRVDSSTTTLGSAGRVSIYASDSVEVSGVTSGSGEPSLVTSTATTLDQNLRDVLRLFGDPTGISGELLISTRQLIVADKGQISVRNDGNKEAGNLEINADSISLDTHGSITATAASEQGGDIRLNTQNLQLRNGSSITTDVQGGIGNGGNITIDAGTLTALESSNITANAFQGQGGNIQINTQSLFSSLDSDITASSELGIDGVVDIRTLGFDVTNTLTPLTGNLVSTEQIVANSCLFRRNATNSSFVVTGSGGLPTNPYSGIEEWESLTEVQPEASKVPLSPSLSTPSSYSPGQPSPTQPSRKWKIGDPIVQAQEIIKTADGRLLLGVLPQGAAPQSAEKLVCSAN